MLQLLLVITSRLDLISLAKGNKVKYKNHYTWIIGGVVLAVFLIGLAIPTLNVEVPIVDTQRRRYPNPVGPAYMVVAANAPGWMRSGGPGRYLCDGTNDEVEINAASTACAADGGGTVQFSSGTFTVSLPASETDVVLTADLLDETDGATVVDDNETLDFSVGTFANMVVGQVYRLSGGQDGSDDSVEDNFRDMCSTVVKKTAVGPDTTVESDGADPTILTETGMGTGVSADDWLYVLSGTNATVGWYQVASATADTVTLTADAGGVGADWIVAEALLLGDDLDNIDYGSTAGGSGGQPTLVRMRGCVKAEKEVLFLGAGIRSTYIKLADSQNCCVVIGDDASVITIGFSMENMTIDGNQANQGDNDSTIPLTFHPECNGVVLSEYYWDCHFRQCINVSSDGDGWVILQPWGSHVYGGGWTEWHSGSGVVYGAGSDPVLSDHKIASVVRANARDANASNRLVGDSNTFTAAGVLCRGTSRARLSPAVVRTSYLWAFHDFKGYDNRIVNVDIDQSITATNLGGIRLDPGVLTSTTPNSIIIANNSIRCTQAGTFGIYLNTKGTVITGNVFRGTPNPIEVAASNYTAEIQGNFNCWITDATRAVASQRANTHLETLDNDSGSTIDSRIWVKNNGDHSNMVIVALSTTSDDVRGYLRELTANGTSSWVQIEGYIPIGVLANIGGAHAVAVGDPLCCSDNVQGWLEEAGSGDWVVAIAMQATTASGNVQIAMYILPPGERYLEP